VEHPDFISQSHSESRGAGAAFLTCAHCRYSIIAALAHIERGGYIYNQTNDVTGQTAAEVSPSREQGIQRSPSSSKAQMSPDPTVSCF
jgi:hypothetical protein